MNKQQAMKMLPNDIREYFVEPGYMTLESAIELMANSPGMQIYIPKLSSDLLKMVVMENSHLSIKELSNKFNCSERTIYRIMNEKTQSSSQLTILDQLEEEGQQKFIKTA